MSSATPTSTARAARPRRRCPPTRAAWPAASRAAVATPGGAVFVLVAVLLVAIIISNPNFGEPGVLIRFVGPHRADRDRGDGPVLRDRLRRVRPVDGGRRSPRRW